MSKRIPLFPNDPSSPWYYTKQHSSGYWLFAVSECSTVSWGRFKTKAALIAYALDQNDHPFNYPF
jgi:hypothetical protein